MGKKRKLGQLEEAQPQAAEKRKQVFENLPVPEIEAGPEEPPPPKKRKKPKKQKEVAVCVDVAGEASEPSKEVGLVQAKPAEAPLRNPTVGVESLARTSSNPVAEIEVKAAAPLLLYPVGKSEEKSEDVKNNGEAQIVDGGRRTRRRSWKERKKNKKEKLMEMQGNVNDVEKTGMAEFDVKLEKPVQVVAAMEGSKDKLTVWVGVESNGEIEDEVAKLLAMHGLTMTAGELENMKRKRKEDKEMGRIYFSSVEAGKIDKQFPFLLPKVMTKRRTDEAKSEREEMRIWLKKCKQAAIREKEERRKSRVTVSADSAGQIIEGNTSEEHNEDDANVEEKPKVLTESEELEIWLKKCKKAASRAKDERRKKSRITVSADNAGQITEGKTSEEHEEDNANVEEKPKVLTESEELEIWLKKCKKAVCRAKDEKRKRRKSRITVSADNAGQSIEGKTSEEHKEDSTVTNAMLTEGHSSIPTSTEWRKRQPILGLRRKAESEKSTEEKVDEKMESTNGKVEKQTIDFLQVCVICRGKGHIISTCPVLNQAQINNKNPECSQPLQQGELNGISEPVDTLVKDKSSGCKADESMGTLKNEEKSGVKEDKSTVKNGKETRCTPEDIVMKDENTDNREGETTVKVDCASRLKECYVKRMAEQGPEAVNPVS